MSSHSHLFSKDRFPTTQTDASSHPHASFSSFAIYPPAERTSLSRAVDSLIRSRAGKDAQSINHRTQLINHSAQEIIVLTEGKGKGGASSEEKTLHEAQPHRTHCASPSAAQRGRFVSFSYSTAPPKTPIPTPFLPPAVTNATVRRTHSLTQLNSLDAGQTKVSVGEGGREGRWIDRPTNPGGLGVQTAQIIDRYLAGVCVCLRCCAALCCVVCVAILRSPGTSRHDAAVFPFFLFFLYSFLRLSFSARLRPVRARGRLADFALNPPPDPFPLHLGCGGEW